MMYIDNTKLKKPSKKWLDKADTLLEKLKNTPNKEDRNKIIDQNHRIWKLLKDTLKELSFGKCWYSETKNPYSQLHIDHFRPKKRVEDIFDKQDPIKDGYWWLTFDISNYRLCGSVGNIKKGDHFAVKYNRVIQPGPISDEVYYFLDPTDKEDVKLVNFDNTGIIRPAAPEGLEKWNYDRAKYTIEFLDLNYPDLQEARKIKWQETTIVIKEVNRLNVIYNNEPTNQNRFNKESEINKLRIMLSPEQELTSTVRSCLRASGEDWAYKLLEE